MGRWKSLFAGMIITATALTLAACTSHHVRHPAYREAGPAHHHRTTVVHPPARHRTVIVRPPARHRTVIVQPPARHRTVIVHPSKRHKRHVRQHRKHRDARRDAKNRYRKDHRGKAPVQHRQPGGIGLMRNPHRVQPSRPVEGHISGGRPGRPDVVMPKTKPRKKQSSRSLKRQGRQADKGEDRRRSKRGGDDRRERDKGE